MTAMGLPYYFEDTTGLVSGPTDYLDIYDRPPFLRLATTNPRNTAYTSKSRALADEREAWTLKIFELGSRSFTNPRRQHRDDGTPPSAVLALDDAGRGMSGSVKFRGGPAVALERWLKKSTRFGSTLMRQFKASDGMYYQWSFHTVQNHEWACVQLGTNRLVAHYDIRLPSEPIYRTSGNVFTVQENYVHLSVELLASLVIMRHLHAISSH